MWLLNDPPRQLLKKKYDFDLTDAWLEHAQKASVRFNNGGSGGFVSPDGLIVTNHHIGADQLQKLSGKGKDYLRDGFFARATSSTPTYRPVTSPFTGWVSSKRCASSTMPGRWSAS
ncbi:MAG: S46 family peptidase [Planctomycetes bacterium]|nr:S46 family peptidase [Planctomycetota bacterium]